MILPLKPDPVPLREDSRGGFRFGDSRVPLDVVVEEYENGADPESIVIAYPTLQLDDVYAVIAYYLRHRDDVKAYLREREAKAAELRQEIESQQPDRGEFRAKLLARRAQVVRGKGVTIRHAIDDLLLIATCGLAEDFKDQVKHLPL